MLAVGPGPRLRGAQKRDWPHLFRLSQPALPRFLARFTPSKTLSRPLHLLPGCGCTTAAVVAIVPASCPLWCCTASCQPSRPQILALPSLFLPVRPIAVDASLSIKVPFTPQKVKKVLPGLSAFLCTYSYRPCTSPLVPRRPFFLSNTALQTHQHRASKSFSRPGCCSRHIFVSACTGWAAAAESEPLFFSASSCSFLFSTARRACSSGLLTNLVGWSDPGSHTLNHFYASFSSSNTHPTPPHHIAPAPPSSRSQSQART